jgi:Uma2 family endonuclease
MSIVPSSTSSISAPLELNGGASFVPIAGRFPGALPHRWTVAQVMEAIGTGFLPEDSKVELIRGELIRKMPVGKSHMAVVKRLIRWFSRVLGERCLIGVQDMIELADSLPEPDFTLLVPVPDCYESRTAQPSDILLLIEVADSSLAFDQKIKLPIYAENAVRDYWIVNLIDERIEVYRQPQPGGTYADAQHYGRGKSIAPLALSDVLVPVDEILGSS